MLDSAAEWPGMTSKFGRELFQESRSSRWVQRRFESLQKAELISGKEAGRGFRYSVRSKGFNLLALRDRVSNSRLPDGVRPVPVGPRLQDEEDGIMDLMGEFAAAGVVGAAGWRCREYMGGEAIAPDGLVYLEHSPYGPGWHYLEYERSVRGRGRLERKMRGYASPRRMNDWPVLLVVWDSEAEVAFQQVGREAGVPMLTSTVERIKKHRAVRDPRRWSMYGEAMGLG